LESLAVGMLNREFWRDKRVFVTGHTGFMGGWLTTWLADLGAQITGYALAPDTDPSYFAWCSLESRLHSTVGDVRDYENLLRALKESGAEIVFHLAAQPLVLRSYRDPATTFSVNVMGTVNLLEAVRVLDTVRAVLVVTSDKCYENREWPWGYRENEPLGGHDPYSASKGCAELVAGAYTRSFFQGNECSLVGLATLRAGNVIGGGDWADNRIVPDIIRALRDHQPLYLRNPSSIRPWQHVLEPLAGYLTLAERLYADDRGIWKGAWNFGPSDAESVTVIELAQKVVEKWGAKPWQILTRSETFHEANYLKLDCSKARKYLNWCPLLDIEQSVQFTADWYREALGKLNHSMYEFSLQQLRSYEKLWLTKK
jgi:CDP-glucose 4,6-dehydratase